MKRIFTLIVALIGIAMGTTATTVIISVEGTSSPKFVLVPQVGTSVLTYPKVTVTKGSPAVIYAQNGEYKGVWQKKNGSNWDYVYSGEFTSGTWRFNCLLCIPNDAANNYDLSPSLTVKIDDEKWEVESVTNDEYGSYAYINSPEYVVDGRQIITDIEATSNFDRYLVNGKTLNELGDAEFNITTGAPATLAGWHWIKYDETAGEWPPVYGGDVLTAGQYHFCVGIYLIGKENLEAYRMSPSLTLKVNGVEWERTSDIEKGSNYVFVLFQSPLVTIGEGGTLGTQGTWEINNGVLTIDYDGDMPQDVTLSTTDPEKAYRLVFEPYLKQIQKVVIKGHDVGVQPYLFYFEGDGPDGTHPDDNITEITISSGVKSIGKQAFVVYNLKHFYTYREMPPTLSSDNGGSNVFWQKRITANLTRLHELNKSGVGTNYARTNTEWVKFAVITNDLNQTDDPNYADVVGINALTQEPSREEGAWYTLDGRRMQGKPVQKGLYIRNGKKMLVK